MARGAARGRRPLAGFQAVLSSRLAAECSGVALLGLSLLTGLALASYVPSDPVFERAEVGNRAGIAGATLAALLFGCFGLGALVCVGATAVVGVRLALGRGLPAPTSRFWVSSALLLLSFATLPPLLQTAFPGFLAGVPRGALGLWLADGERLFIGVWGALLTNVLLLVIGAVSATGASTGALLGAAGALLGGIAAAFAALTAKLAQIFAQAVRAAGRGVASVAAGLRPAVRVEVGDQALAGLLTQVDTGVLAPHARPVQVRGVREHGLRQHGLHLDAAVSQSLEQVPVLL